MSAYYIPLPAAQVPRNAMLDFGPLGQAVEGIGEAFRGRRMEAKEDARYAEQSARAKESHASVMADRETQRQRSEVEWYGKKAFAVDQMPAGPQRAALWQRILSRKGTLNGLSPEEMDPITGPKLMAAEAGQFVDSLDRRYKEAQIAELSERTRAHRSEADSKALLRDRTGITRVLGVMKEADTPQKWQQNSPIIEAVFGRPVPFSERGMVLVDAERADAESGKDEFEPSARDRALGLTREMKMERARQEELRKTYGEPKRGYKFNADGSQALAATPTKAVDESLRISARVFGSRLEGAEKKLIDAGVAKRTAAGPSGIGELGEAVSDYEAAVRGLVYTLSGKTVTNKEFESFMGSYMPQFGLGSGARGDILPDSDERIRFKTQRLKSFMDALVEGISGGIDSDEALARAMAQAQGGDAGSGASGMTDEELLRALEQ